MGLFNLKNLNPANLFKDVLKTVGSAAEKVGGIAGGIAKFGEKLLGFLKKPASEIIEPITNKISEQINKIPYVGKFLAPVVDGLLKQGVTSLVGEGPIGGIGALAKATSKIEDVTKVAEQVRAGAEKVGAWTDNVLGQQNVQNLIAQRHAAFIE
ncbi:hypothetical protein SAMN05443572_11467 [Myxococcus fulvus]|uniref:Uncharacterized protein n=1 Tax=Myxococcus fulvus TaxID=33 RepID=A0A511TAT8_MYXFU|nr:hypothetical protein [Myxococcus fulvus]GEN11217.1 hypothetical protein MFU01_62540 [Myxococcus fulvus]SEU39446.1 hypothetical protein SAMN05443572_11467 [Myxococcus fulvus]